MAKAATSSEALVGPAAILADEMLAGYLDWREDAAAVADVYQRWSHAPAAEEAMWFSAYLAALEQEEASARSYALAVANLRRSLPARQRRTGPGQPQTEGPRRP